MLVQCSQHTELLDAYVKALTLFNAAVQALQKARATAPCAEYERIRKEVELAHLKCEQARIRWEAHRAQHGC